MPPRALLLILAGVPPEHEAEFNLWYDREHLPERVGIPGFLSARRHAGGAGALWPYLALYEVAGLEVFRSAAYRERLASQSAWSRRLLPLFVAPQRNVAHRVAQVGEGIGAACFLAALRPAPGGEAVLAGTVRALAEEMRECDPSVVSVGLYASDPELSRPVAEYAPVAASPVRAGDWFLVLDTVDADGGAALIAALDRLPLAEPPLAIGRYRLRSAVSAGDVRR